MVQRAHNDAKNSETVRDWRNHEELFVMNVVMAEEWCQGKGVLQHVKRGMIMLIPAE
jgi:hypothetical protein